MPCPNSGAILRRRSFSNHQEADMRNIIKRSSIAAVALVFGVGLGACDSHPLDIEEPYEVQMTGETTGENCIYIEGQLYCDG